MSRGIRRRRAVVLLALALACGGLAASRVSQRVRTVEAQVGAPVPVVVAREAIRPDEELTPRRLGVREVPERFVPADALARVGDAAGQRTAVPVPAGSYLTASQLQGAARAGEGGPSLGAGQRALELSVAGGEALTASAAPGSRVDVLVSTERGDGSGRSFLALERVELLALRAGGAEDPAAPGEGEGAGASANAVATLRVTPRQAIYLTAAQNFAREIRLLPRPPGDDGRLGRAGVDSGQL